MGISSNSLKAVFGENFCRLLMPLFASIAAVHRQFFPVAYSVICTHLKLETNSSLYPSLRTLSSPKFHYFCFPILNGYDIFILPGGQVVHVHSLQKSVLHPYVD
jgi:hypothetical protein